MTEHDLKRVNVTETFPCDLYKYLTETRKVQIDVISGPLVTRRTKSQKEIEQLNIANSHSAAAFALIRKILKESTVDPETNNLIYQGEVLTSEKLKTEVELNCCRLGSISMETIIAGGVQATDPHC